MTELEGDTHSWNDNGQLKDGLSNWAFVYNWDGKLRSAGFDGNSVALKYDPTGNRAWKETDDGQTTTTRKYIVDIIGRLPVILCEIELDPNGDPSSLEKSYIYSPAGQILCQKDPNDDPNAADGAMDKYFYVHDRLGSVRCMSIATYVILFSTTGSFQFYAALLPQGNNPRLTVATHHLVVRVVSIFVSFVCFCSKSFCFFRKIS